ncbi:MAG: sulfite exporter TauE/SafE family protein [Flavobacterium sp.]|nr:sulfite exporter TauE/SafE family protein [Flavobacterium sp.]
MSSYVEFIFLFLMAVLGGALNGTISGGWFIVFPSLIYGGVQPINGNASTMAVLLAGDIASSEPVKNGYEVSKKCFRYMLATCAIGGLLGAYLLVFFSHTVFETIAPYLLLCSWLLFVFYNPLLRYINYKAEGELFRYSHTKLLPVFILGIYGGYFGAGMGMLICMLLTIYGIKNNDTINGMKILLISLNNGIAIFIFLWSGLIYWPFVIIMIMGSAIGGYFTIAFSKRVNIVIVKRIMIVIGAIVTLYFLNIINLKEIL